MQWHHASWPHGGGRSGAAAPASADAEEEKKAADDDAAIDFLKVRIRRDKAPRQGADVEDVQDDAAKTIQKALTIKNKKDNHGFQVPSV